jgi:hypothetical protein
LGMQQVAILRLRFIIARLWASFSLGFGRWFNLR